MKPDYLSDLDISEDTLKTYLKIVEGISDEFIKKYSQDIDINKDEYLVSFTPFDLVNLNKNTWYNRYSWNPDYTLFQKYVPSKFEEVNQINKIGRAHV